jgi:hypothetical protein
LCDGDAIWGDVLAERRRCEASGATRAEPFLDRREKLLTSIEPSP